MLANADGIFIRMREETDRMRAYIYDLELRGIRLPHGTEGRKITLSLVHVLFAILFAYAVSVLLHINSMELYNELMCSKLYAYAPYHGNWIL